MREVAHPQLEIEAHYDETIRRYADVAQQLLAQKERVPPHHIWTAIRSAQGPDRTKIFCDVVDELRRRRSKQRQQDRAFQEIDRELAAMKRAALHRDAAVNQYNQPRDTWNTQED